MPIMNFRNQFDREDESPLSRLSREISNRTSNANRGFFEAGQRFSVPGLMASAFPMNQGSFTSAPSISDRLSRLPTGQIGAGLNANRPTSIQDILEKLESLQDPDRYGADPELLARQAMAMASAQYDPVISQLRNQAGVAQSRAERNKAQLGGMFQGLSNSLMGDIAPIQQQYANTKQQTADQYTQLQNQLKSQYSESQAQQEAMLRRLNIEAAAPDVFEGQTSDKDMYLANAATESQNVQSQLAQQEGGAVNYTRQGAELARTEGTNRQADLMANLSDYLAQIEGQVGANEAAKQQSYIAQLTGLQTSSQESAIQNAQRDFENYIKVLGVMQDLQKQGPQQGPVKSLGDVAPKALSMGVDADGAQAIQNVFMSALSSDPVIQSGLDPKFGVSLTEEALANRVSEVGRQRGLNQSQLNALQQIALEYFGRR
jgi:hypothetical protein